MGSYGSFRFDPPFSRQASAVDGIRPGTSKRTSYSTALSRLESTLDWRTANLSQQQNRPRVDCRPAQKAGWKHLLRSLLFRRMDGKRLRTDALRALVGNGLPFCWFVFQVPGLLRTGICRRTCSGSFFNGPGVDSDRVPHLDAAIVTDRLTLIPGTVNLARAEIEDRREFARLLGGAVPDNWPPESAADALPLFLSWLEAAPDQIGWFGWYALAAGDPPPGRVLVAGGGFLGPPQDGAVQMGYSVLPQFQRQGYATELVGALARWAFAQTGVERIVAETEWANPASVRVLEKTGFVPAGKAAVPEGARFQLRAP